MTNQEQPAISGAKFVGVLAVCCVVPMGIVVLLTSVLGLAIGWAAAVAIGSVAAALCIGVMVLRHGPRHERRGSGEANP